MDGDIDHRDQVLNDYQDYYNSDFPEVSSYEDYEHLKVINIFFFFLFISIIMILVISYPLPSPFPLTEKKKQTSNQCSSLSSLILFI